MKNKKHRNQNQKKLLKLKVDKDLSWKNIEKITGYTRQNIDHAFKNETKKTIQKVFEKLELVWQVIFLYTSVWQKSNEFLKTQKSS